MTWGWLTAILDSVFNWGQKQAEKPKQTTDAKTPSPIKRNWARYLRDKLRNKNGSGN